MNEAEKFLQALEGELADMVAHGYDFKSLPLRLTKTNELIGLRVEYGDGSVLTFMRELLKSG